MNIYKKQVSVIILNFNTFDLTCTCIQSIIKNTLQINYEIILVDNASSECKPDKFKEKFPFIKLVRSDKNIGFSKGNNLGISVSHGEVILLLNSDTILLNDAISICYQRIKGDNTLGLLSCKIFYSNGKFQYSGFKFPSILYEFKRALRLYRFYGINWRKSFYLGIENKADEFEADWVIGAFLMFRRNILLQLPEKKLYDHFFMYEEDIYWGYIVKNKLNLKNMVINSAEIIHHEKGSKFDFTKKTLNFTIYQNRQQWMTEEKGVLYTTIYLIFVFIFESTQLNYPFIRPNNEVLQLIYKTLKN